MLVMIGERCLRLCEHDAARREHEIDGKKSTHPPDAITRLRLGLMPWRREALPLWQSQHLSRLDQVRVGQLIAVGLEDLHVGARVAQMRLRDLAERVARLDGIGRGCGSAAGAGAGVTVMSATMSSRQSGMVLMSFQISFLMSSEATVPLKKSFPSFSSALP